MSGKTILEVQNLSVSYGAIRALNKIDLVVRENEIVTIIGSNGAGKSTTMNAIMGVVKTRQGKIFFLGKDITSADTREIVRSGLVLVPEGRQVFPEFSVEKNLDMGGYLASPQERQERKKEVFSMFPVLRERKKQPAGMLSGGEQQMLAIGRALLASPVLLMMDEPSLGLAPLLIKEVFNLIRRIRGMGASVLLVEQNARMALSISDKAYVLNTGNMVINDDAIALLESEEIRKAYLGG
ncbi:MAG: ABC transporter ATP-binding protein [Treponema sp.]|nr:ABC transporter ATP-binding protein [Treponema sp.]